MEKITVDEVIAAYEETGMTPAAGQFNTDGAGCALGVLAMSGHWGRKEDQWEFIGDLVEANIGGGRWEATADGFNRGYQGAPYRVAPNMEITLDWDETGCDEATFLEWHRNAYEIGTRVRELFHPNVVEERIKDREGVAV